MYTEVREHLRRQHAMNTQEIRGKHIDNSYKYSYYENNGISEGTEDELFGVQFLGGKVFLFLTCIMLFSCYLYGGQDIKKGAAMAWSDMNTQIARLEENQPAVKQAMGYVRKAYNEMKDFSETYLNLSE